jgi:hypothetical protein
MTIYVPHSKIVIAGLDYIQPVAAASYLQVNVVAEVTMPDVLSVEIITPADDLVLAFSKKLVDASVLSDLAAKTLLKPRADIATTADVITHKSFGKKLTDSASGADALVYALVKTITPDSAIAVDAYAILTAKVFADVLDQPTDSVTGKVFHKVLADSISFSDSTEAHKLFIRTFDDSFATPDLYASEFFGPEFDSAAATDAYSHVVQKNFFESTVLIDNMDGDIEYHIIKLIGELLGTSDSKVIDFTTNKSDNVVSSDGGVLSMQDYCDITYFAEDYVGLSRTF